MAEKEQEPRTTSEAKPSDAGRHDHVWANFTEGDGSAAHTIRMCTICGKRENG